MTSFRDVSAPRATSLSHASDMDAKTSDAVSRACARGRIARVREDQTVYKDECVFSFDSPSSASGVYVNVETLYGYGRKYVALDTARTGCETYVCVRTTRTLKETATGDDGAAIRCRRWIHERRGQVRRQHDVFVGVCAGFRRCLARAADRGVGGAVAR